MIRLSLMSAVAVCCSLFANWSTAAPITITTGSLSSVETMGQLDDGSATLFDAFEIDNVPTLGVSGGGAAMGSPPTGASGDADTFDGTAASASLAITGGANPVVVASIANVSTNYNFFDGMTPILSPGTVVVTATYSAQLSAMGDSISNYADAMALLRISTPLGDLDENDVFFASTEGDTGGVGTLVATLLDPDMSLGLDIILQADADGSAGVGGATSSEMLVSLASITIDGVEFPLPVVGIPEPSAGLLAVLGCAGATVMGLRRRRRV